MELRQYCGTSQRRQKVRAFHDDVGGGLELNGIDYLEVLDDDAPEEHLRQRLIDLVFLKPDGVQDQNGTALLSPDNVVVEGGTRITGVRVQAVEAGQDALTLRLTLDRAGDFSPYRLRLRAGAMNDDDPPANMDPVLSTVIFSFKADCRSDFDCRPPAEEAPRDSEPGPTIDYLAKDYDSFRQLMLDRMAATIPEWRERSPADLGVTLVEMLAYAADHASYYQDAVATEAYLPTARRRTSVRRHARLLGYRVGEGANARTFVAIRPSQDAARSDPPLLARGTRLLTRPPALRGTLAAALRPDPAVMRQLLEAGAAVFETMEDVTELRASRHGMRFYTWGEAECCLPTGTTLAHLQGSQAKLGLAVGDVLILEELVPRGGTSADPPDQGHRQAVRLSAPPRERVDPLTGTTVLEVRWHPEDALAFPLNLAGHGGRPGAVAHGNVVLADHGRTLDFGTPRPEDADAVADSAGLIPDTVSTQPPYRPRLDAGPVTFAVPFDPLAAARAPARRALRQDPAGAQAQVALTSGAGETWRARADLLASDRFSPEFVVETDDAGDAGLRFGDGRFAKRPTAGTAFTARVRVGNGPAGQIGADAIGHVITDDPDLIEAVRNPLPAAGAAAPEPAATVKINAPRAFRRQRRAVTAGDYVAHTEAYPDVQRAYAERRWTGSWHTMFVAVDRLSGREVDAPFEAGLRRHLEAVRLAGHDLEIEAPLYVPLDVALVVCVAPGHVAGDVERALLRAFGAGVLPDGGKGYFHPDNFSFGTPVYLSPIIARAMQVRGVRWVGLEIERVTARGRFRRLHDQAVDYGEDGVIRIGRREVARLDNDPNAPERGRIEFIMEGGA